MSKKKEEKHIYIDQFCRPQITFQLLPMANRVSKNKSGA